MSRHYLTQYLALLNTSMGKHYRTMAFLNLHHEHYVTFRATQIISAVEQNFKSCFLIIQSVGMILKTLLTQFSWNLVE